MRVQKTSAILKTLRSAYSNWLAVALYFTPLKARFSNAKFRDGTTLEAIRISPGSLYELGRLFRAGWKISSLGRGRVLLRGPRFTLACDLSAGNGPAQISAVYLEKIYGTDFSGKVVVDIGTYIGDSAIYFVERGARAVIGLEPSPATFDLANENLKANSLEGRVKVINAAITSAGGMVELGISSSSPEANSLAREIENSAGVNLDSRIRVKGITLEDVVRTFGLERIDVLKLNCEGCEYQLIQGLKRNTSAIIGEIILEFHNGVQGLSRDLVSYGFEVIEKSEFRRSERMGFLYAKKPTVSDSIYQRGSKS